MTPEEEVLQEKLAEQGKMMYQNFMGRTIDILDRMKDRFGPEVSNVVDDMVGERTLQQWKHIAQSEESHDIADLIRVLWEPLKARGFEYTTEEREDGVQIYCTKCALYDLAKEINGTEWMFHLNCGTDPHIVAGFNPEIKFNRTKTLMEGDDCCDHFYGYPD